MILLSPEEVAEWTGYKQAARQIRWLTSHGHKFDIGADGLPKVARSYWQAHYGEPEKKRPKVRTEGLARA